MITDVEILDYLKKEVGERAAVPKQVFIVPQIPLTPVGKIFKPALRWESIKKGLSAGVVRHQRAL